MNLSQSVLLGIVQGLTEFLPISSDGHLTLFQHFLQIAEPSLAMDVALHVGTLGAMIWFFRNDIDALVRGLIRPTNEAESGFERRRALLIVIVSVFTAIVGFSLKPAVEQAKLSLIPSGAGFLVTAVFLFFGEWRGRRPQGLELAAVPWWHVVLLGVVQGAAVWPGWSRSGSTIGLALVLGWAWPVAGRFCFLMAIPAIMGATLLEARAIAHLPFWPTVTGVLVSFWVGLAALAMLMRFLAARRLWPFAVYCAILGVLCVLLGGTP